MDGTAASRSTRLAAGRESHRGAYCVMNRATPTPTGTAIAMAMSEDATVVQSISTMPKRGCSPATVHSREVRKLVSFLASDGMACHSRNTPIRVTRAITRRPALVASPLNSRSPTRPVPAASPARGTRPPGLGLSSTAETPVTDDT